MAAFANKLKQLRERSGLSQLELANILEVSKSTISMYEQGKREPNFEILLKIANIFHVSVDDLLGSVEVDLSQVPVYTVAAHLDTSDLTKSELEDVADYIRFIRSKRK